MLKLSKHTADEIEGRGIQVAYIEAALASPERVAPDPKDPALIRSFKASRNSATGCFGLCIARRGPMSLW